MYSCCIGVTTIGFVHGTQTAEWELEKVICNIVTVDKKQFGFVPGKGTIDVVYLIKVVREMLCYKEVLFICFVDLDEAFY